MTDQNLESESNTDLDSEQSNISTNHNDDETQEESALDASVEENSRFKDGEILTMLRVRFPGNSRSFPFYIGKKRYSYGQKVVAMSDRGMTVGYVNSIPYEVPFNKSMLPVRSISKVASEADIKEQKDFRDQEKKAEVKCIRLIEKYNLEMVITHVEFIQFGKKAVFYFNAPARVDFRDLVKDLVSDLKMRIELRQISVRDRAAALGSVGACGMQTCCSTFLKNYGNVSIKMAKNQNLALIPSKLNGVCGQIKCCIKYEDDVYIDKRKVLPKENTIIKVKNGDIGKVLKLHLLIEQFEMLTDRGVKRLYSVNQYTEENSKPHADYKFPEFFEHVTSELNTVIGLTVEEKLKADRFMHDQLMHSNQLESEELNERNADDSEDYDDEIDGDYEDDETEENFSAVKEEVIVTKYKDREEGMKKTHSGQSEFNQKPHQKSQSADQDKRSPHPHQRNGQNQNQNHKKNNHHNKNFQNKRDDRPNQKQGHNQSNNGQNGGQNSGNNGGHKRSGPPPKKRF